MSAAPLPPQWRRLSPVLSHQLPPAKVDEPTDQPISAEAAAAATGWGADEQPAEGAVSQEQRAGAAAAADRGGEHIISLSNDRELTVGYKHRRAEVPQRRIAPKPKARESRSDVDDGDDSKQVAAEEKMNEMKKMKRRRIRRRGRVKATAPLRMSKLNTSGPDS